MFERYVAGTRTNWQRAPWIVAALFAHVLVGGFIYACSLLEVEEIRPPAIGVMILRAPPPPPPLPPSLGVKSPTKKHDASPTPKKPRVHKIVEPVVQPPAEPPPKAEPEAKADEPDDAEEEEEEGDPDGVVGGAKDGVQGGNLAGVQGGQLGSPAPGVPVPSPAKPAPKMVASFVFDRERLAFPDPHLPEAFKQQHPHETVRGLYRICVGTDGHITKMTTEKSISGVDSAIIQQVQAAWLYKPQPVDVCTLRQFEFRIIN